MKQLRITLAIAGLLLATMACTSPTGTDPGIIDDIIGAFLAISNSWIEEGNPTHSFFIQSENDGAHTGTFTGEEFLPSGATNDVTGNWTQGTITMNVLSTPAKTWTAPFTEDNPTRLEFRSGADTLILIQDPDLRAP